MAQISSVALATALVVAAPAAAQNMTAPSPAAPSAPQPQAAAPKITLVRAISVEGSQRLEPDTVRSYIDLKPGDPYNREAIDKALKDLYATELFTDVQIREEEGGALVIQVKENPVVNRIILEGNKRIKEDKLRPEIQLSPRQIFSRSKVRADISRIIELYRRQGRFAATVEPKMVMLDQNRVDVVFEIVEGAKSKVRKINVIGNKAYSDGEIRDEMLTKETGITKIFSSGTSYDPDRMAYDQQKLRQFYLTNGYADFRVISAVAELTPDKRDFIITYVIEEGERYKFGDIKVESGIRDLKPELLEPLIRMNKGQWYNAKMIEDTVDQLTETAGLLGYAFADIRPEFRRDKEGRTMSVTFQVGDAPRVYVERIDINGNTHTKDKVIRREFRLAEGDAFNSFRVKRSRDRIQSLGFFQEKFEIEQKRGSTPDKVILEANVEEKSTGELQVSAGFSSLERFIVDLSIRERNFMGKGQELRAGVNYSVYSKSVEVGFTEPYLFDRNIAIGGDIFRRDLNSFSYQNGGADRRTTYEQVTTGFQLRMGVPITEYVSLALRYGLSFDDVSLDRNLYYFNNQCDELLAGRYLCEAIGKRTTSSTGFSLVYDNLNNRLRPSAGHRLILSSDVAGLGGSVRYIKTIANARKYWGIGRGFIFSAGLEGGYINGLGQEVRLTDRFFLGEPQIRGFDIRGVGPRVKRTYFNTSTPETGDFLDQQDIDDALGGRAYYLGRLELEIPLGSGAREMGIRPSLFVDAGAVFGGKRPPTPGNPEPGTSRPILDESGNQQCYNPSTGELSPLPGTGCATGSQLYATTLPPFIEEYFGNSPKPRLSVGVGFNWNSPFGPFRIDIAKALLKQPGDDTKLFTFNVGTQF